jgi:hypothetical protein
MTIVAKARREAELRDFLLRRVPAPPAAVTAAVAVDWMNWRREVGTARNVNRRTTSSSPRSSAFIRGFISYYPPT